MKKLFFFTILIFYFSCNKTKEIQENEKVSNGLVVFFTGQYGDNFNLRLTINGTSVYDSMLVYNKLKSDPWMMEIVTNIRDSVGYLFQVRYDNKEKTFYIPAKGLDSLIISYAGFFEVNLTPKTENKKDSVFSIYLTKNIDDNCNVKIASDSDTLYNNKFINNYPPRIFDKMKFTPDITNKGKGSKSFYVEIWNKFIYFYCDPTKYNSADVILNCKYVITTNLDEEWEGCWISD